jgi:hypothetical protein
MFIPWTIRLSTGPALMPPCPSVHVSLSPHELYVLARAIEREADQARPPSAVRFGKNASFVGAEMVSKLVLDSTEAMTDNANKATQ